PTELCASAAPLCCLLTLRRGGVWGGEASPRSPFPVRRRLRLRRTGKKSVIGGRIRPPNLPHSLHLRKVSCLFGRCQSVERVGIFVKLLFMQDALLAGRRRCKFLAQCWASIPICAMRLRSAQHGILYNHRHMISIYTTYAVARSAGGLEGPRPSKHTVLSG